MDASKPETAPAPPCLKKMSGSVGFVANIRESMREFFHTPMEGHKACLMAQYHKFIAKFGEGSAVPKEGKNYIPLQTTVKN